MCETGVLLARLTEILHQLEEQNLLQKKVLNFDEACRYLDISASYLYKLTSTRAIPHYCPQGKKLYFKREELDLWLQRDYRQEKYNYKREKKQREA